MMMATALNIAQDNIPALMHDLGERARTAYRQLMISDSTSRNEALQHGAAALRTQQKAILEANAKDMAQAKQKGLTGSMLDRLELTADRIEAMAKGLEAIAALPDPLGQKLKEWDVAHNGLHITRVSVPLGVIGIIYESRPNVTADAGALCLKSGNAAILRGGSESLNSSAAIVAAMHEGLRQAGLSQDAIQLVPTRDREAVGEMLRMTQHIDVIVPRGGKSLTERVITESRIPTIQHLDGNCHTYLHANVDPAKAVKITLNAKMRRTGICGATESIVIDEAIVDSMLPQVASALIEKGCEVRGDARAQKADSRLKPAQESDWGTEYLEAIVSVKTVKGLDEAIHHINRYSSHHTDAILTEDKAAAERFSQQVDSAIVMINSSTQFADGGEFGMGAEIGISTGRLHARGPVGCDQLVTYKYLVESDGAVRA
jgi:glutamate-5-semialdehyde dehydrogenase